MGGERINRAAFGLLLLALFATAAGANSASRLPNVVLIIADDVSWNNWGFMGDPFVQTPHVDALAAAGTVYEHGMTPASACRPSLQTLLYGLDPRDVERERLALPVPPNPWWQSALRTTLPKRLRDAGFVSFQGGKHWEGTYADAGFDDGTVRSREVLPTSFKVFGRPSIAPVWEFIDAVRDAPFFLWFAPKLPHVPIDPPPEFVARYEGRGLVPAAVQWFANITRFDAVTGELIDGLAARGFDTSNTVFIVLSDNGWEQAPDKEYPLGHKLGGPNGKLSIQEMGWRTPMILAGPGFPVARYGADHLVNFRHVFSTILDLAGLGSPELEESLVDGPPTEEVRAYGARDYYRREEWPSVQAPGSSSFVRTTRWRLTRRSDRPTTLHDIRVDPFTVNDVADEHPEIVDELEADLEQWIARIPKKTESPSARAGPRAGKSQDVTRARRSPREEATGK